MGKGPAFNTLNSCFQVKPNDLKYSRTELVTSQRVSSAHTQPTDHEPKAQGSPIRYKYSTMSQRTQENCSCVNYSRHVAALQLYHYPQWHIGRLSYDFIKTT